MNQDKKIIPITMPGIHERFYRFLKPVLQEFNHPEILEVGAGHGAFARKLWNDGYAVSACDLFPEIFYFDKIECRKADISRELPFPDQSFDIILAV